ncbi:MAG: hypothetical protein HY329_05530 [Chloroflexi bacterium]|nr:hypothetical protein [Chloroflexota bacterium]
MAKRVRGSRLARLALLAGLAVLAAVGSTGCGPESERGRGGGPGADIGNRVLGTSVELHGRTEPYYLTPAVGTGARK